MFLKITPNSGFTLIEVLIVTSIVAILLCASSPMIGQTAGRSARDAETVWLSTTLQRARSEAIGRNSVVALCPRRDDMSCDSGGRWDQGWIMFNDINRSRTLDQADVVIALRNDPSSGVDIVSTRNGLLFFYPDGRSPGSNTTFTVCPRDVNITSYALVLNNGGRTRTLRHAAREGCG